LPWARRYWAHWPGDSGDDPQAAAEPVDRRAVVEEIIARMTRPPAGVYHPDPAAKAVYDRLYGVYCHGHDHFGREHPEIMKRLKDIAKESLNA
jgi:hypothetical protein